MSIGGELSAPECGEKFNRSGEKSALADMHDRSTVAPRIGGVVPTADARRAG
jgi:hypothetical protein